ncbi:TrmB family transcriptional regulator [Haloarcula japonica]|uniref:Transcription regulator n=1 Tax=Haloarcula japonica (strain ATCC 49778 / DSM 6131 / JCM 7785 / NBRC 101032 / NCIMB 13157 / TR-1) TaxID=1227453 RepID=M0LLT5_HALJT|nr:TrmB family transcriptional regulator sugar-binding domain-containing protein [Haloarcula japonica]EMA33429.1 transcription regulator [Haloarcula japonica DSM 6131]
MDDSTLRDRLEQLGLSEKEVDTYLSILGSGEATASEIADDTGVSKRYVYSISESLEDRGFVEVNDHVVPTTIRARPPEEVIDALTDRLEEMSGALDSRYSSSAREPQQFDVIKSRVTVIKRLTEYIRNAEREIMLSVPQQYLPEISEELAAAVDRGVLVMLVVSSADGLRPDDASGLASVVRSWDQPMPIMLTVDAQFGLVSPTEMVTRTNSDQRAIAFVQQQLVPVLSGSFLGNYWLMATEETVTDPAPLPATYHDFRHAVLQATLHLRAGHDVQVSAEVRPVQAEDDTTHIEGVVVETKQGVAEPQTNSYPIEHTLLVDIGDRTVSLGGSGSFIEDYETDEVTLSLAE